MLGSGVTSSVLGKVGYAAACLAAMVVIVVAGYAHGLVKLTDQIEGGASIGGGPSVGAMNILLMGLESRTDFDGNTLSSAQLTQTHSGSNRPGGNLGAQDTDTLILIHVFAGGQKAIGYSIPRDDVVNYPHTSDGVTEGKIDGAYNYAYTQYVSDNVGKMGKDALYQGANAAGQVLQVQTVESVTGVHIDHFVVSNIYGFELIASELGGMEVCLKPAPASIEPDGFGYGGNLVDLPFPGANFKLDSNSGFNAVKYDGYNSKVDAPQYLHLSPPQALAFVRARDSLPGVDIGRTHRQQAAIDYIIYDLKNRNVLTDPTVISSLLTGASSYLKTDSGFSLLDFAPEMKVADRLEPVPRDAARRGGEQHLHSRVREPAPGRELHLRARPPADGQRRVLRVRGGQAEQIGDRGRLQRQRCSGAGGGRRAGLRERGLHGRQVRQLLRPVAAGAGRHPGLLRRGGRGERGERRRRGRGDDRRRGPRRHRAAVPAGRARRGTVRLDRHRPAGRLETYGGSTVTAQDFSTAAQENHLPASELPPATATAGTQSVSSALAGARAQASADPATKPSAKPSADSTSPASDNQAVPANARFGIPCVY